jgi:hypothetical protein
MPDSGPFKRFLSIALLSTICPTRDRLQSLTGDPLPVQFHCVAHRHPAMRRSLTGFGSLTFLLLKIAQS